MKEEFRSYNDRIEVSNLGNVKKCGKPIKPYEGRGNNPYDFIQDGKKILRVHVMVGELFPEICGKKVKWGHLHHINRDKRDNRAENLIWLTRSEHRRIHQLEDGRSKGVKAYDLDGNFVGEWGSINQAEKATGISHRHITTIIRKKERRFTAGGYYWFSASMTEEEVHKNIFNIQDFKYQQVK